MIVLDLNQVMFSSLLATVKKNQPIEEDLIRHIILNQIRYINVKFKEEYGQLVIACDSRNYWRKQIFPYYKAHRAKQRADMGHDWEAIFKFFNNVKSELKEFFPYPVVEVDGAEADDVIATVVNAIDHVGIDSSPLLIVSGDKDFIQLHRSNVKQYDPIRKRFISHDRPLYYLAEHIIRGDSGDGIPNVLSDDNCFVVGGRQKPITAKRLSQLLNEDHDSLNKMRNYARNAQLIDLKKVPEELQNEIFHSLHNQQGKTRGKLISYFMSKKLRNLMDAISDF